MPSITEQLERLFLSKEFINKHKSALSSKGLGTEQLTKYANEIRLLINAEIDAYYGSYEPTVFRGRTGNLKKALQVHIVKDSVYLDFDEKYSFHPSLFGEQYGDGYTPLLINDGWHWSKYPRNNDHFHDYNGFHFIENGLKQFRTLHPKAPAVCVVKRYNGVVLSEAYF